jgi:hypothetical protein
LKKCFSENFRVNNKNGIIYMELQILKGNILKEQEKYTEIQLEYIKIKLPEVKDT